MAGRACPSGTATLRALLPGAGAVSAAGAGHSVTAAVEKQLCQSARVQCPWPSWGML